VEAGLRVLANVMGTGGVRAIVEHLGLPTASEHLAPAASRLGRPLGWAGIISKHRVRIEVDSTLGVGTRFRVVIPMKQAAQEDVAPA
jgi:nitrogen-specific signal transduction histidine kinase